MFSKQIRQLKNIVYELNSNMGRIAKTYKKMENIYRPEVSIKIFNELEKRVKNDMLVFEYMVDETIYTFELYDFTDIKHNWWFANPGYQLDMSFSYSYNLKKKKTKTVSVVKNGLTKVVVEYLTSYKNVQIPLDWSTSYYDVPYTLLKKEIFDISEKCTREYNTTLVKELFLNYKETGSNSQKSEIEKLLSMIDLSNIEDTDFHVAFNKDVQDIFLF